MMSMQQTRPPEIAFTLTLRIPATRPVAFRVAAALRAFLDNVDRKSVV